MKPRIFFISLLFVPACLAIVALPLSTADGATLEEIISNVKRASTSPTGYQVKVTQTEIAKTVVKTTEEVTAPSTTSTIYPYMIVFDPIARYSTRNVTVEDITSTESMQAIQDEVSKAKAGGAVRITMDIEKLLDDFRLMGNVTIASELRDGQTYYRIAGQHADGSGTTAWIDPNHWNISEIAVVFFGQPFSRMTLMYKNYGTFSLPSQITIHHYADGTQVVQAFDEYRFVQ